MARVAYKTEQVARKEYECNACLWVRENPKEAFEFIPFADLRLLVKFVRQQRGKILKGQRYERITHSIDGELYTICAHPDVNRIAIEHDLYPEDSN